MPIQTYFLLKPVVKQDEGALPKIVETIISEFYVNQTIMQTSTQRLETLQSMVSGGFETAMITRMATYKVPNTDYHISLIGNEDAGAFGENAHSSAKNGDQLSDNELQWLGWVPPLPNATVAYGSLAICKDLGTDFASFTPEESKTVLKAILDRAIELV